MLPDVCPTPNITAFALFSLPLSGKEDLDFKVWLRHKTTLIFPPSIYEYY